MPNTYARSIQCLLVVISFAVVAQGSHSIYRRNKESASTVGNGCPESAPWPCKTGRCLSFDFICDGQDDCPDKYDEDPNLCTAKDRPALTLLSGFIEKWSSWLIPKYLGQGTPNELATRLIESKTLDDYAKTVRLTDPQYSNLKKMLEAINNGRQIELVLMGMPVRAWNELYTLFKRIVESGFLENK